MNHTKTKIIFCVSFSLCCCFASLGAHGQVQDSTAVKRVAFIAEDLGISPQQASDVMAIIDLEKAKASDAKREAMQVLSVKLAGFAAERDKALQEVLTDEQLTKIRAALRSRDHALSPNVLAPDGIR
ncbi:hypothetical protein [Parapedobacter tibetensis]|uniref:hypothetical protein n=1 Tax=Parapedobacter tibetensis TaxID=2972951 RepID=UPI00214DBD0E|nr:hypothetical protein [Parapedobacter tibetensis]